MNINNWYLQKDAKTNFLLNYKIKPQEVFNVLALKLFPFSVEMMIQI